MAGKTNLVATLFAQKKLLGKANTSVAKSDSQEIIGSNIQVGAQTIFGEDIPENPEQTLYLLQSASYGGSVTAEWVQFDLTTISGTTYDANDYDADASAQSAGVHAYKLALSGSYESLSSNPKKGNGVFDNSKTLFETLGACQIIPPNFSGQSPNPYIMKLYYDTPEDATEIPLLDDIDWSIDYYNGILFIQDFDNRAIKTPKFARAFIYVGAMLSASLGGGGGGGSGDITSVVAGSGLTGGAASGVATLNVGAGTGITVSADDVAVDNSIVATLTGSQFSGNVGITGSLGVLGDVEVAQYIKHIGDDDTFIQFADDSIGFTAGGEQLLTVSEAGTDMVTVGDGGDVDFRVRTENDDNTLYIEGSTDRIGIGTNSPSSIVHIKESAPTLTLQRENNSNASTINFVGASSNTGNSIIHDSSTNDLVFKTFNGSTVEEIMRVGDHYGSSNRQIILLSGSSMHAGAMQPRQSTDIAFFVSGSVGSKGTSTKGTAVFGGDVHVSGTIHGIETSHILVSDDSSLTNARVLTAGDGITISTANPREIVINNSGAISRSKTFHDVTASHASSKPFDTHGVNFSTSNYDFNKIDVILNGQHLRSGSQHDYVLLGTGSIVFDFALDVDDTVQVITF